jgi:phosphoserine phosphatase
MTTRPAAFFRVEGALSARPAALAAAWLAANAQHVGVRAARLGAVALSAPFALGLGDPTTGHRLAWAGLRGMSDDRLAVLGEEYFEGYVRDQLRPVGLDLLGRARADGLAIVLVSDNLDVVVEPLAEQLRADLLLCNHLELRSGRATGRLCDPVVSRFGGAWLREVAEEHELDLSRSRAYGATGADQVLLSAIGHPCAVHPDRTLRRVARDLDWPVVDA